ncbi:TPA: hypothetical protein BOS_22206 [Bos taurus]|nr:TPA: hypothetical protein BOS_22206 [Bos taurus]
MESSLFQPHCQTDRKVHDVHLKLSFADNQTESKRKEINTETQTSTREQGYSPADNLNSLPIWDPAAGCRFFQTESQNCRQSTCCCCCDNTLVPAPAAESDFNQLPPAVGSRPRSGEAGTPGSPGLSADRNQHFSTSGGWSSVVLQRQPSVNPMSF